MSVNEKQYIELENLQSQYSEEELLKGLAQQFYPDKAVDLYSLGMKHGFKPVLRLLYDKLRPELSDITEPTPQPSILAKPEEKPQWRVPEQLITPTEAQPTTPTPQVQPTLPTTQAQPTGMPTAEAQRKITSPMDFAKGMGESYKGAYETVGKGALAGVKGIAKGYQKGIQEPLKRLGEEAIQPAMRWMRARSAEAPSVDEIKWMVEHPQSTAGKFGIPRKYITQIAARGLMPTREEMGEDYIKEHKLPASLFEPYASRVRRGEEESALPPEMLAKHPVLSMIPTWTEEARKAYVSEPIEHPEEWPKIAAGLAAGHFIIAPVVGKGVSMLVSKASPKMQSILMYDLTDAFKTFLRSGKFPAATWGRELTAGVIPTFDEKEVDITVDTLRNFFNGVDDEWLRANPDVAKGLKQLAGDKSKLTTLVKQMRDAAAKGELDFRIAVPRQYVTKPTIVPPEAQPTPAEAPIVPPAKVEPTVTPTPVETPVVTPMPAEVPVPETPVAPEIPTTPTTPYEGLEKIPVEDVQRLSAMPIDDFMNQFYVDLKSRVIRYPNKANAPIVRTWNVYTNYREALEDLQWKMQRAVEQPIQEPTIEAPPPEAATSAPTKPTTINVGDMVTIPERPQWGTVEVADVSDKATVGVKIGDNVVKIGRKAVQKVEAPAVAPAMPPEGYTFAPLERTSDRTFYHGTKANINDISEVDVMQFSKSTKALFGEGLYLTDNPDVAKSYSSTTKGKGIGKVLTANLKDLNLIDLETDVPDDVYNYFSDFITNLGNEKPETKNGDELFQLLKEALADNDLPDSEAVEYFQDIHTDLSEMGYDGFKYTGGKRTALGKKMGEHNVVVLFPENLKGKLSMPPEAKLKTYTEVSPKDKVREIRLERPADVITKVEDEAKVQPLVYRGITDDEFQSIQSSGMIHSRQDYSVLGEGTSFAQTWDDAESYINYGRDNPVRTGKPTYVLEVSKTDSMKVDKRDYYVKSQDAVPASAIQRIWKLNPDGTVELLPPPEAAVAPETAVAPEVAPVSGKIAIERDIPNDYNNSTINKDFSFMAKYKPIRIGVTNAMQRRQDMKIAPIIEEDNAGGYFGIKLDKSDIYVIVPREQLTIQRHTYLYGAGKDIFDFNPDINLSKAYSDYRIRKPALFKKVGDKFEILQKGVIDLTPEVAPTTPETPATPPSEPVVEPVVGDTATVTTEPATKLTAAYPENMGAMSFNKAWAQTRAELGRALSVPELDKLRRDHAKAVEVAREAGLISDQPPLKEVDVSAEKTKKNLERVKENIKQDNEAGFLRVSKRGGTTPKQRPQPSEQTSREALIDTVGEKNANSMRRYADEHTIFLNMKRKIDSVLHGIKELALARQDSDLWNEVRHGNWPPEIRNGIRRYIDDRRTIVQTMVQRAIHQAEEDTAGLWGDVRHKDQKQFLADLLYLKSEATRAAAGNIVPDDVITESAFESQIYGQNIDPAEYLENRFNDHFRKAPPRVQETFMRYKPFWDEFALEFLVKTGVLNPNKMYTFYAPYLHVDGVVMDSLPDIWLPKQAQDLKNMRFYRHKAEGAKDWPAVTLDAVTKTISMIRFDKMLDDFAIKMLEDTEQLVRAEMAKTMTPDEIKAMFKQVQNNGHGKTYLIDGKKYDSVQYRKGRIVYPVETVDMEGLRRGIEDILLDAQEIVDMPDDQQLAAIEKFMQDVGDRGGDAIRLAYALGRYHRVYLVPEPIADSVNNFRGSESANKFVRAINAATQFNKTWTRKWSGFVFEGNNIIGDTANMMLTAPGAVRSLPNSAKILFDINHPEKLSAFDQEVLQICKDQDVLGSGFMREYSSISLMEKSPYNIVNPKAWLETLDKWSGMREAWQRVAMVHYQWKRIKAGKDIDAFQMEGELEGLTDKQAVGYVGRNPWDYPDVPKWYARGVRGAIFPWATFYQRLAQNTIKMLIETVRFDKGGKHIFRAWRALAGLTVIPMIGAYIWNTTGNRRKIYNKLGGWTHNPFMLILRGYDEDEQGNPTKATILSPRFPQYEFMQMLGLDEFLPLLGMIKRGEISKEEAAKRFLYSIGVSASQEVGMLLGPAIQIVEGLHSNRDPYDGHYIIPPELEGMPDLEKIPAYAEYIAEKMFTMVGGFAKSFGRQPRKPLVHGYGTEKLSVPVRQIITALVNGPLAFKRAAGVYEVDLQQQQLSQARRAESEVNRIADKFKYKLLIEYMKSGDDPYTFTGKIISDLMTIKQNPEYPVSPQAQIVLDAQRKGIRLYERLSGDYKDNKSLLYQMLRPSILARKFEYQLYIGIDPKTGQQLTKERRKEFEQIKKNFEAMEIAETLKSSDITAREEMMRRVLIILNIDKERPPQLPAEEPIQAGRSGTPIQ